MGGRTFLPTGRFERRIAKTEVVELLHVGESPIAKVEAITENVSSEGARVITDSICAPGKLVRLDAPEEHLKLLARVVYCQRLEERKYAVGLKLNVRVEKWQKLP
ncbi:MAG TPA: PilZ domain-containing protein [Candidatus Acidoferrales bacterium]|nr:PilZ domain-containing protein [Candidatus Acidoferrales bacterium]